MNGRHKHAPDQRCAVPFCGKPAVVADLCTPCYSAEVYWAKKTPGERARRAAQLKKFSARMLRLRGSHLRRVK